MKLPISQRLLLCAALVPPGARVADVGCDHGYLGIHLLKTGTAKHVIATDLREKPLEKARENARRLGADGEMDFFVADGLGAVSPGQVVSKSMVWMHRVEPEALYTVAFVP